ncbi:MAG: Rrf2 family transcriptional regulator [Candidatus Zixiibacteriota bacterium]
MFSFSKKTEYGLIALSYLSTLDNDSLANVAEIAESSSIPRELLAKILSELVKAGLAISYSGPTGGFRLAKPAQQVSLAEIISALETKSAIIHCVADSSCCDRTESCRIRTPMSKVKQKVDMIFEETTLKDIADGHSMKSNIA